MTRDRLSSLPSDLSSLLYRFLTLRDAAPLVATSHHCALAADRDAAFPPLRLPAFGADFDLAEFDEWQQQSAPSVTLAQIAASGGSVLLQHQSRLTVRIESCCAFGVFNPTPEKLRQALARIGRVRVLRLQLLNGERGCRCTHPGPGKPAPPCEPRILLDALLDAWAGRVESLTVESAETFKCLPDEFWSRALPTLRAIRHCTLPNLGYTVQQRTKLLTLIPFKHDDNDGLLCLRDVGTLATLSNGDAEPALKLIQNVHWDRLSAAHEPNPFAFHASRMTNVILPHHAEVAVSPARWSNLQEIKMFSSSSEDQAAINKILPPLAPNLRVLRYAQRAEGGFRPSGQERSLGFLDLIETGVVFFRLRTLIAWRESDDRQAQGIPAELFEAFGRSVPSMTELDMHGVLPPVQLLPRSTALCGLLHLTLSFEVTQQSESRWDYPHLFSLALHLRCIALHMRRLRVLRLRTCGTWLVSAHASPSANVVVESLLPLCLSSSALESVSLDNVVTLDAAAADPLTRPTLLSLHALWRELQPSHCVPPFSRHPRVLCDDFRPASRSEMYMDSIRTEPDAVAPTGLFSGLRARWAKRQQEADQKEQQREDAARAAEDAAVCASVAQAVSALLQGRRAEPRPFSIRLEKEAFPGTIVR